MGNYNTISRSQALDARLDTDEQQFDEDDDAENEGVD